MNRLQGTPMYRAMTHSQVLQSPSDHNIKSVIERLFKILEEMESQSTDSPRQSGGGLQWFGGARHQAIVKNRWLREIRRRLNAENITAETNVPMPGGSHRCDLLIHCGSEKLWLKMLGIWKEYCRRIGMLRSYKSALFHPLLPNLEARTNSAANCLTQLNSFQRTGQDHTGLLILGFDSAAHTLNEEVDLFCKLSGLNSESWNAYSANWEYNSNGRTALWMWVSN